MQCDHQLIASHLTDLIENRLSPQQKKECEKALHQCGSCMATFQQAQRLHQLSSQWEEQSVPDWHRTKYAVRPVHKPANWLNWSALATSALALLMVVFQVQISSSEQGVQIAFGGNSNAQFEAMLEKRMQDYKAQQSLLLDARLVAERDKLQTANKLMLSEAMEKTRDERRDDLNFLITGIQTQRFEDQAKVEKRLAYLADNQIENNQYINQLIQSNSRIKGDK